MNTDVTELLGRYLANQTTEEETQAFERALKTDARLRALYLDHLNIETALEAHAEAAAFHEELEMESMIPPTRMGWFHRRQLIAAAAGLIVGLFSASVVFGYVIPLNSKAIILVNEGFESGPAPLVSGIPDKLGVWGGDFSEVVGAQQGITPQSGKKMLRFLRADYAGKPPQYSYSGDLYRLIDVRGKNADIMDGKALVTVSASFRTIPFQEAKRFQCGFAILALDALPSGVHQDGASTAGNTLGEIGQDGGMNVNLNTMRWNSLAVSQRQFALDPAGVEWQKFRAELRVPSGTKYLLVRILMLDLKNVKDHPENMTVEFPGQFVDNIDVSLSRNVPLP